MPPSDPHESDPGGEAPRTTPPATTPIRTPPVGNTQCGAARARTSAASFGTMPFDAATAPRAAASTHLVPPGSRRRVRRKTGERP
ncbi:hypothetical protein Amir_2890 [Actinosynnema mirum DSM 43827]|uniref:Uncharacterized protein n=1 Tax=Actinosynnema mirum (strain ATCC 29888 / DSM 43827 / JCM 3225 / NBRC 14064 / NCIMB 13271 / NRRL B-12336 / IMRU 3971 / 101) TaxID=446462 RepID=C6WQG3_ACTMD|nr:hypothetical protein Amir_2890 [Actinosynnema mirum DSM 43827]